MRAPHTAVFVTALASLTAGCFQTTHWNTCQELDRAVVADTDTTPAGMVGDLRARVLVDATLPAVFADDEEGEVDVLVEGTGDAEWVEQEVIVEKTRSFGFGSFYPAILVTCPNHLSIPVSATVRSEDGSVDVMASGPVAFDDPTASWAREVPAAYLSGSYSASTFPADWSDKASFINLDYDDVGLIGGTAGWGGFQENSSVADYVVDFLSDVGAVDTGTDPQ